MKLALAGAALAVLAVSGCAAITDRTGLSTDTQECIAVSAVAVLSDPETRDLPMVEKIAAVASMCGLGAGSTTTIQTAILAADLSE